MKNVYLFEFSSGNQEVFAYLPHSTGRVWSYAMADEYNAKNYRLIKTFFLKDHTKNIIDQMTEEPHIVGLSVYIWNIKLNKLIAQRIREKWPDCTIIAGGPSGVELNDIADTVVIREGERAFSDILKAYPDKPELLETPMFDLDSAPSPYLTGYFDEIVETYKDTLNLSTVFEYARGCPYMCAFCTRGNDFYRKIRKFNLNTVLKDLDWIAENRIDFLYAADDNFGILPEYEDIVDHLSDLKAKHGVPDIFLVTWAKNKPDRVFDLAKKMQTAGLSNGICVAIQSLNQPSLDAVHRINVDRARLVESYHKYRTDGIHTFVETIYPLPLETLDTYRRSYCGLIEIGEHNFIPSYLIEILKGTEFNTQEYQDKYGIKTKLLGDSGSQQTADWEVEELSEFILETNTFPHEDLLNASVFKNSVLALHFRGFTQYISRHLNEDQNVSFHDFYVGLLEWAEKHKNSVMYKEMKRNKDHHIGWYKGDEQFKLLALDKEGNNLHSHPLESDYSISVALLAHHEQFYKELTDYISQNYEMDDKLLDVIKFNIAASTRFYITEEIEQHFKYNWLEHFEEYGTDLVASDKMYVFEVDARQDFGDFVHWAHWRRKFSREWVPSISRKN